MNKIKISQATEYDSVEILSFIQGLADHLGQADQVTATKEDIENTLFSEDSPAAAEIAYYEDVPAGFVLYFKTYSTFSAQFGYYIEDLFVVPEFRGKGIGSILLKYVLDKSRENHGKKVEWYVNNTNKEAVAFYNKLGAKKLDYKSIFYIET